MERFTISHYKMDGSSMFVNGGTLAVTDGEYIIEYGKKEVARFSSADTTVSKAASELLYDGIRLRDKTQSVSLSFLKGSGTLKAVRAYFSI